MKIAIQTKGCIDDAVSIDIHAVVCADIMMHVPSSQSDHVSEHRIWDIACSNFFSHLHLCAPQGTEPHEAY